MKKSHASELQPDGPKVFDRMVAYFEQEEQGPQILDVCMTSLDPDLKRYVSRRYRLIAKAFAGHYPLERLNESLEQSGFPRLYARSPFEASLIYAFRRGLRYDEWRKIVDEGQQIMAQTAETNAPMTGGQITVGMLRDYVRQLSQTESTGDQSVYSLRTRHETMAMNEELLHLADSQQDFRMFFAENRALFSSVREKTRYYFCKYLLFMIQGRIDAYLGALKTKIGRDAALEELGCLVRCKTVLDRRSHTPEEAEQVIDQSPLSPKGIYTEFDEFYLNYTTVRGVDHLMTYYSLYPEMTGDERSRILGAIRRMNRKVRDLDDDALEAAVLTELDRREDELDRIYSDRNRAQLYQKRRSPEGRMRDYLQGKLDPDRVTLINFLLFFAGSAPMTPRMQMTQPRMDEILSECGYSMLSEDDAYDRFVLTLIRSEEPPADVIEAMVTSMAVEGKDSPLCRSYIHSVSEYRQMKELLGDG